MKPLKTGFIKDGIHKIHYETYGNPKGNPWLFCHGGPGYYCVPESNLKYFNLKKDYVILFDQRGAGKSRPSTSLKDNTTCHLISDMNAILDKLKITKVNILGGSWGSTLALAYSINYPEKVHSLVLRGIFLGRDEDVWAIYKPLPSWSEHQKIKFDVTLGALYKEFKLKNLLTDGLKILKKKDQKALEFAKKWAGYEDLICTEQFYLIDFDKKYLKMALDISTIEIHYFVNHCFLPKNYILNNVDKLKNIKVSIVQGARDMVTPKNQALELATKLSNVELYLDPDGGHSSNDSMTKMMKKMVSQTKKIR